MRNALNYLSHTPTNTPSPPSLSLLGPLEIGKHSKYKATYYSQEVGVPEVEIARREPVDRGTIHPLKYDGGVFPRLAQPHEDLAMILER